MSESIELQRLDVVLKDIASQGDSVPLYMQEFESILRSHHDGFASASPSSLRALITDFVIPRISDPTIFQTSRYTSILSGVVSDIEELYPSNSLSAEIKILFEEILSQFWSIQDRRHKGS